MPQTHTVTTYQFDELDEKGKEKARDWWREQSEAYQDDLEFTLEDAAECARILGITLDTHGVPLMNGKTLRKPSIWWSGFASQGDGACFEGAYSLAPDAPAEIREHAPQDAELHRIADELAGVADKDATAKITHRGHYYHEHSMDIEIDVCDDETSEAIHNAMVDFARWIYDALEAENDWRNADEQVDENIRANEYEFYADGRRAVC